MNEETITKAYEMAVERYAALGVDVPSVLAQMQDFHLSLHCWQADDVAGFEVQAGELSGGIQATGNYPGKARNIDELQADILKAASLLPGTHRFMASFKVRWSISIRWNRNISKVGSIGAKPMA